MYSILTPMSKIKNSSGVTACVHSLLSGTKCCHIALTSYCRSGCSQTWGDFNASASQVQTTNEHEPPCLASSIFTENRTAVLSESRLEFCNCIPETLGQPLVPFKKTLLHFNFYEFYYAAYAGVQYHVQVRV